MRYLANKCESSEIYEQNKWTLKIIGFTFKCVAQNLIYSKLSQDFPFSHNVFLNNHEIFSGHSYWIFSGSFSWHSYKELKKHHRHLAYRIPTVSLVVYLKTCQF